VKTIMLFEDEQAISRIFCLGFERLGYSVLQAATYRKATQITEQYQPPIDLLIADMGAQVSTCVRVARAITSAHPQVAVLFISELPPAELARRRLMDSEILSFPRIEFLRRPFMPWVLQKYVQELIGLP